MLNWFWCPKVTPEEIFFLCLMSALWNLHISLCFYSGNWLWDNEILFKTFSALSSVCSPVLAITTLPFYCCLKQHGVDRGTSVLLWFSVTREAVHSLPTCRMGFHLAVSTAGLRGNASTQSKQAILIYTDLYWFMLVENLPCCPQIILLPWSCLHAFVML